jgi:predicted ABC-type sugar transport system permease subunit
LASFPGGGVDRVNLLSTGAAIGIGAVVGLALGILVSVTTDVPLAPEVGLLLGVLAGWLSRREASQRR